MMYVISLMTANNSELFPLNTNLHNVTEVYHIAQFAQLVPFSFV